MSVSVNTPVTFTASAIQEIKRLMSDPSFNKNLALRVGVKGGGCSGMTYVLNFDDPTINDSHFEVDGVNCIIDKAHALYLAGMEINWEGGLNARGFIFNNPNASSTCGCGTSFAV